MQGTRPSLTTLHASHLSAPSFSCTAPHDPISEPRIFPHLCFLLRQASMTPVGNKGKWRPQPQVHHHRGDAPPSQTVRAWRGCSRWCPAIRKRGRRPRSGRAPMLSVTCGQRPNPSSSIAFSSCFCRQSRTFSMPPFPIVGSTPSLSNLIPCFSRRCLPFTVRLLWA